MKDMRASIYIDRISGPDIALPSDQGPIDLHAYMSFKCFSYAVDRTLVLQWDADHPGALKVKDGYVMSVELVFVRVRSLAVTPRDPEVPFEADQNLEDFEIKMHGDEFEMALNFNGGMKLGIIASDIFANLTFESAQDGAKKGSH